MNSSQQNYEVSGLQAETSLAFHLIEIAVVTLPLLHQAAPSATEQEVVGCNCFATFLSFGVCFS